MTMRRAASMLAVVATAWLGAATQAEAVPIISVTPTGNQIEIGLTNLEDPVGGFSFLLDFDNSAGLASGYTVNPAFGTGFDVFDLTEFNGGAAVIDFNVTSFLDPVTLSANQGDPAAGVPVSLLLVTVDFGGNVEQERFSLRAVNLSNNDGTALIPVCVEGQPCGTVPEPATMALLMTGAAVFAVRRRIRRK
jgi:hypothetical protein